MVTVEVVIEAGGWIRDDAWPDEATLEAFAQRAAAAALAAAPDVSDEALAATLLLADDAAVRALNRAWRGKDSATNVLSFPSAAPAQPGEPRHLGDIALAYETLVREAAEEDKSLADHAAHLIVHGILHLLGEDHDDDPMADAMEAIEIAALARLGIPDPYRDPV